MSTKRRSTAAERKKQAQREARRLERRHRDRRRTAVFAAVILGLLIGVLVTAIVRSQGSGDTAPQRANSPLVPGAEYAEGKEWAITLATNHGDVDIALDGEKAPQATSVLLALQQQGFFDGTDCHRLRMEEPYLLQCGDPTGTGTGGPPYRFGPIENAPSDDVYPAGSVVMVREQDDAYSMGSQFFIVYRDSAIPRDEAGGYTIVGHVTEGLDNVRQVAEGGTITGALDGQPAQSVILTKVTAS